MKIRIGLNGFGNLARVIFRQLMEQPDRFEVLGVNDLADPKALAVLLKYDSVYGRYKGKIEYDDEHLIVDGRKILITSVRNPAKLPWGDLGVSVGIENNLYCRDRQMDGKPGYDGHLSAGAKRVLLTMTARYHDRTVIAGLNDSEIIPEDCCISCGSGAAGAIAPIVKVLNDRFGVRCGQVTSIDSYSSDQQILDSPHHELHRARAAAINIIPTYNFAVEEVGSILPELRGKLLGLSLRVPTPVGRCVDLVINTEMPITAESVNAAMKEASETELRGVLGYSEDPIVLSDIVGDPHAAIIAANWTCVVGNHMLKLVAWYDNQWSYSSRVVQLVEKLGEM